MVLLIAGLTEGVEMKTSELQGAALDWAVGVASGAKIGHRFGDELVMQWPEGAYWSSFEDYSPSTDWSQGGTIIEREKIQFNYNTPEGEWVAERWDKDDWEVGPTPLVAAMRCYVASKLGDEVEIPEEITKCTP